MKIVGVFKAVTVAIIAAFMLITLTSGEAASEERAEDVGQLRVVVHRGETFQGIPGATVQVYDKGGVLVAQGVTSSQGLYLATLPEGRYRVYVRAIGYDPQTQYVEVYTGKVMVRFRMPAQL